MYRDAKEELKRLEEALLKESEEVSDVEETEEAWEESQEEYTEEKKPSFVLLTIVFTLAALTLAVLIFWFVCYGRGFL